MPYEEVANHVLEDMLTEKAHEKIAAEIKDLANSYKPEVVAEFVQNVHIEPLIIKIDETASNQAVSDTEKKGLPVARMKKMIHPGYALIHPLHNGEGVDIIILDSIEKVSSQPDAAKSKNALKQVYREEFSIISAAFIDSLQKNATIKDEGALNLQTV